LSQYEDRDGSSLVDDVREEVKQEEVPAVDLKKSQPSAEELEIIVYLQKLDALNEKKYSDNLIFILENGFTNFEVNLNLLKRNNNDLSIVIKNLCNSCNITESMFI
jgi:beta-galactosidase/beta-glucuronidase